MDFSDGRLCIGKSLPFRKEKMLASLPLENRRCCIIILPGIFCIKNSNVSHFHDKLCHLLLESGMTVGSEHFETLAKRAIESAQWLVQPNGLTLPFGDSPPIPVEERAHFEFKKQIKQSIP